MDVGTEGDLGRRGPRTVPLGRPCVILPSAGLQNNRLHARQSKPREAKVKGPRRLRRRLAAIWYHRRPQLRWWGHFLLGLGALRRWRQRMAWGGGAQDAA